MKVTIFRNGEPARNVMVLLKFDGFCRGEDGPYATDSSGKVEFGSSPGDARVFINGRNEGMHYIEDGTTINI